MEEYYIKVTVLIETNFIFFLLLFISGENFIMELILSDSEISQNVYS